MTEATLDKIFSLYIRTRDSDREGNGFCCTCKEIIPIHLKKSRKGKLFTAEAIFKKQQYKTRGIKGKWFLKKGAIKANERAEELFNKHAERKIKRKNFK